MTQGHEAEGKKRERDVSTFALDTYWAAGRSGDVPLDEHVATCDRCRAYLASLDAWGAAGPPLPAAKPPLSSLPRRRWALPVAGAIALAAGVAILVGVRAPGRDPTAEAQEDAYVGVKGAPAVQLFVHRDRDTRIWDGRSPIRPGDALALRVACEGLKRVIVASPGPSGWARLSSAACPGRDDPLPFTLRVDSEPGDEKLAIVLSQGEIDDETLQNAIAETRRSPDVWVVRFVMPKETEINR